MTLHQHSPQVGYLLKTFPKLSETFILNEIVQLEKLATPLHLFSLRVPGLGEKFHPALSEVHSKVTYVKHRPSFLHVGRFLSMGVHPDPLNTPSLMLEHLKLLASNPIRYVSVLWFYLRVPETRRRKDFMQAGALTRGLQKRNIRHLHAHFANIPASVAELVHRFSGITFSFTAHAKDIYLSSNRELSRKMRAAKFVLTCTGYNKKYLEAIGSGCTPIYLAYHGVDLSRFQPIEAARPDREAPQLLSVGRFCEKKGFPYLIRACHILKQRGWRFSCAIVGCGPLQEQMEKLIAELNLASQVSLLAEMTHDRLVAIYQAAEMFVLPCILTEDGDRDGIPNVLIEAMAMRLPVVSTDVSGIPELVDHMQNGLLVPEKDTAALANAMEVLLSRPDLRARFGGNGRSKVMRQFTLERNVGVIQDLLLAAAGMPPEMRRDESQTAAGTVR
jgi:glycosyltransferase involved in cell wall biosynthesis